MSTFYRAVGWNHQKRRYDAAILSGVLGYLIVFVAGGFLIDSNATIETLVIRIRHVRGAVAARRLSDRPLIMMSDAAVGVVGTEVDMPMARLGDRLPGWLMR
jgi:hypothetical protein